MKYELLAEIETNIQDEHAAISSYYKLWETVEAAYKIGAVTQDIYKHLAFVIEEVIREELKHSRNLQAITQTISGLTAEE